jgi:hypothetical protein
MGNDPDLKVTEYQLVRPDGAVLTSTIVPEGYVAPGGPAGMWSPRPGIPVQGRCYGRVRTLPGGSWKVIACYPEGFWAESYYDEASGAICTLGGPVLWDMTGESDFQPFNPADPAEPRVDGPCRDTTLKEDARWDLARQSSGIR